MLRERNAAITRANFSNEVPATAQARRRGRQGREWATGQSALLACERHPELFFVAAEDEI